MENMITRHRFEIRRRILSVSAVEKLTPHMIRITLTGEDMAGFQSPSFDDHVKLVFAGEGDEKIMREYTPRAFDEKTMVIDFAIHEAGPATAWAIGAKVGDTLAIGGPRGSAEITGEIDWWLMIADETALAAMGRNVEALPAGKKVITLGAIPSDADRQSFETEADHIAHWVTRPEGEATDPAPLLDALQGISLPSEGKGFIWIAAEAKVARALRDHFQAAGHPLHRMKAAGYWTKGMADTSDKTLE